ncbi:MAG: ion transporter [Bryobacterales bacterium]|nr:ion transporter [Bryobacterales bacterium]
MRSLRTRVYEWLEPGEQSNRWEHVIDVFLVFLILASVIVVVLQSMPDMAAHDYLLSELERWCVYFFTLEYALRVWTCVENPRYAQPWRGRLRYMTSAMGVIDLLALAPFYLAPLADSNTVVFRLLRIFRLIRVLKFGRYNASIGLLGRVFRSRREELLLSLVLVVTLVVISSTFMYAVEHDAQPVAFSSIPAAMWWGIVTMTTVGYGDVFPVTTAGKVVAGISVLLGVGLFALPAGILASGFSEEMQKHRKSPIAYQRVCFYLQVKRDRLEEYKERHRDVWPEMLNALSEAGWCNYSLFLREDGLLIGYLETPDFDEALRKMAATGVNRRWQEQMAEFFEGIPGRKADEQMQRIEEVFHLD